MLDKEIEKQIYKQESYIVKLFDSSSINTYV